MLTQVTAQMIDQYTGAVDRSLAFTLEGSEYVVHSIEGLGPVQADILTVETPTQAGDTFLSSKAQKRNIVMELGFNPNHALASTITGLRRSLMEVYMPQSKLKLIFSDDVLGDMYITGYVEKHEPTMFSEDPKVQISIICPEPYFRSTAGVQTINLPSSEYVDINYTGNVPVGFTYEGDVTSATPQIYVSKLPTEMLERMYINFNFLSGDHFLFCTVPGSRKAQYVRSSATNNALGYLGGSLTRTMLRPGVNHFDFQHFAYLSNCKLTYEPLYGGL